MRCATRSYAVLLRRVVSRRYDALRVATLRYIELCSTTQRHTEPRSASRGFAVIRSATLSYTQRPCAELRSTLQRHPVLHRAMLIQEVLRCVIVCCTAQCFASPSRPARCYQRCMRRVSRPAIKDMRLAFPASRSKTDAFVASLQLALLVVRFDGTRFPMPLLMQIFQV